MEPQKICLVHLSFAQMLIDELHSRYMEKYVAEPHPDQTLVLVNVIANLTHDQIMERQAYAKGFMNGYRAAAKEALKHIGG